MTSGGSGEVPRSGYYADPSIPGYIRYWNGVSWVPGTSRPEPAPGEVLTPPPGAVAAPRPAPPQVPSQQQPEQRQQPEQPGQRQQPEQRQVPPQPVPPPPPQQQQQQQQPARSVPAPAPAPEPASRGGGEGAGQGGGGAAQWGVAQPEPTRVSWGQPAQSAQPAQPLPQQQPQQQPGRAEPGGPRRPEPRRQQGGQGVPGPQGVQQPVPWTQQVSQLARQEPGTPSPSAAGTQPAAEPRGPGPGSPAGRSGPTGHVTGQTFGDNAMAWRPPPSNPFLQAAQSPARPSGLGRRLVARLIDSLVVGAVVVVAGAPLALAALEHLREKIDEARLSGENAQVWLIDGTTGLYLGVFAGAVLLAGFLYEALPTAKWGRTLGKRLVRVRVLDIEGHDIPTFGQSVRRWLVYQVLGLLVLGVVNVIWCLFDRPWRQCWHDKSARTFVAADGGS